MAIDILFSMMVVFGFYFGYKFGLIRVVLYVISLLAAVAAAMRFTPMMEDMIRDTFEVDSVFLPFFAFLITLGAVLLLARVVVRLLEDVIDNRKFNIASQVIGGLLMCGVFAFLFSVLVTFFSEARVINPEEAAKTSKTYGLVRSIPDKGKVVLERVAPFIQQFVDYMQQAIKAINKRNKNAINPKVLDPEDSLPPEYDFADSTYNLLDADTTEEREYSIDTSLIPIITPNDSATLTTTSTIGAENTITESDTNQTK